MTRHDAPGASEFDNTIYGLLFVNSREAAERPGWR
jgi:hypothetical protein